MEFVATGIAWYFFGYLSSGQSRVLLQGVPSVGLAVLLTLAQFIVSVLLSIVMNPTIGKQLPTLLMEAHIFWAGIFFAVANLATNISFIGLSVGGTQIVKATEPVFSLVIFLLFDRQNCQSLCQRVGICVLVTAGVLMISFQNAEFNAWSVAPVILANLSYQLRNFVIKKFPSRELDPKTKFAAISLLASLVTGLFLPLLGRVVDAPSLKASFNNGVLFGLYQLASFSVLSCTSPLHHSLLNAGKRTFIIIVNSWVEGRLEMWTLVAIVGLFGVVFGNVWASKLQSSSTKQFKEENIQPSRKLLVGLSTFVVALLLCLILAYGGDTGEEGMRRHISVDKHTALMARAPRQSPRHLWWYGQGHDPNIGDRIGPWLWNEMRGYMPKIAKQSTKSSPSLYSVGSIITFVSPGGWVWGSGIIKLESKMQAIPEVVTSVRGPLTRNWLMRQNISAPAIYGDPAMALPLFRSFAKPRAKKFCIIPHTVDYEKMSSLVNGSSSVMIIDLKKTDVDEVLIQFEQCNATVSSSLHGVIISVAYGIPTRWVMLSNRLFGDNVKFWDFFLSLKEKKEHNMLVDQALEITAYYIEHGLFPSASKYPHLEDYFPLDLRKKNSVNVPYLTQSTRFYKVASTLIDDIISSWPFGVVSLGKDYIRVRSDVTIIAPRLVGK